MIVCGVFLVVCQLNDVLCQLNDLRGGRTVTVCGGARRVMATVCVGARKVCGRPGAASAARAHAPLAARGGGRRRARRRRWPIFLWPARPHGCGEGARGVFAVAARQRRYSCCWHRAAGAPARVRGHPRSHSAVRAALTVSLVAARGGRAAPWGLVSGQSGTAGPRWPRRCVRTFVFARKRGCNMLSAAKAKRKLFLCNVDLTSPTPSICPPAPLLSARATPFDFPPPKNGPPRVTDGRLPAAAGQMRQIRRESKQTPASRQARRHRSGPKTEPAARHTGPTPYKTLRAYPRGPTPRRGPCRPPPPRPSAPRS